jgi:hypothetical protein
MTAATKPARKHRFKAFLLMVLFVAVGAAIVFYANHTAHEGAVSIASSSPQSSDSSRSAADLKPADKQEMVVVEASKPLNLDPERPDSLDTPPGLPTVPSALESSPSDMKQQLQDLGLKTKELEIQMTQNMGSVKSATSLAENIGTLQKSVLEMADKVSKLEALTLATSEAQKKGVNHDMALLLATTYLSQSAQKNKPFTAAMTMVEKAAANNGDLKPILDELKLYAGETTPTDAELTQNFAVISRDLLQAQTREDAKNWSTTWGAPDWLGNAIGKVASLVTVRKEIPDESDKGVEATITRVNQNLIASDFDKAASEMTNLPESLLTPSAVEFKKQLTARAAIDKNVGLLQQKLVERVQQQTTTN